MNEEELMRMKKIEKREKVDIALAYMLIVILLGAIVVILYLKFIKKEEPRQDDQLPTYISLNEITAGLNSSTLANRYTNDGATFTSTVSNDAIVVTYTKGEQNININIPLVNNELQVNIAKENEKIITIEDTLELHLDKIFPHRDIVAMKTNNIASYSDVLVTCMRQNPRWILLSEVRSAEAVMAVRNSISSGHNILSTIHADKAESIPSRMYSLLETNQDVGQFLTTIHRYVQLGVHIKGYYSQKYKRFHREVSEVVEFYVTEDNKAEYKILYKKTPDGHETIANPSKYLLGYLESQGVIMPPDILVKEEFKEVKRETNNNDFVVDNSSYKVQSQNINNGVNKTVANQNQNIIQTNNQRINGIPNSNNQNNTVYPQNIPNIYGGQNIPRPVNINNISNS